MVLQHTVASAKAIEHGTTSHNRVQAQMPAAGATQALCACTPPLCGILKRQTAN